MITYRLQILSLIILNKLKVSQMGKNLLSLTYYVRADTSQLKQRGNQRVVDLSSLLLPSKWVDKHQQPVWAQRT